MLEEQKKLFKKWKLKLKDDWDFFIVHYKIKGNIKIEKIIKKDEEQKLYDFLFNTYFDYEYEGGTLSSYQLSLLLGLSDRYVRKILVRIKWRLKKVLS